MSEIRQNYSNTYTAPDNRGEPEHRLPNIVWFCADQMRFDTIAALGNPEISTPNIDRLISEATSFKNCYAQNQLCTPSRASFLTGKYPAAHQIYRNGNAYFPRSEKLVTKLFADNGYDCGLIGKLHLSSAATLEARPDDGYRSFEWCQNPVWEKVDRSNAYWNWLRDKNIDPTDYYGETRPYLCEGPPSNIHQMAWVAERAISFIDQSRYCPWLLSINPFDPHPPFDPPPEFMAKYGEGCHLTPPLFRETDIVHQAKFSEVRSQMTEAVNPVLNYEERLNWLNGNTGAEANDPRGARPPRKFDGMAIKAAYYAMIENLDYQFGRILDHLEARGDRENTLIIFTSDHGELLGDHGLLYKGCRFFEGLIHIPLIISWPGTYQSGIRSEALVETIDIPTTLLEAASIQRPYDMQGTSLHGLLRGQGDVKQHKDVVVTDFNDSLGTSDVDHYTQASMTFDGRYKLAIYHSHSGLGELYDLKNDPGEFNCLFDDPDYRSLKHELIARHLDTMMKTIPAGVRRVARA